MRVNSLFQSTTKTLKCSVSIFLLFTVCGTAIFARQQKSSPLPKEDEACLACHGQKGMKSGAGKDISIRPDKHAASAHAILSCKDCHSNIKDFPHATKRAKAECKTCHEQQSAATPKSIHGLLGEKACASCHGSVHEIQSAVAIAPAKCAACHADEVKALKGSIHGQAATRGDPDAPKCESCHGNIHEIQAGTDGGALVAKKNQAGACARCHTDPGFLSRHKIPLLRPVEQY